MLGNGCRSALFPLAAYGTGSDMPILLDNLITRPLLLFLGSYSPLFVLALFFIHVNVTFDLPFWPYFVYVSTAPVYT